MIFTTAAQIAQALALASGIIRAGAEAWGQIKAILAANGYAEDTDALDRLVIDAETRRQRREREASAQE